MPDLEVKICGLSTAETLEAAIEAGADLIGLNFHRASPRYVRLDDAATLAAIARGRTGIVALVADAADDTLEDVCRLVDPDIVQLHGKETPQRVTDIRAIVARPVMKALGVSGPADLAHVADYWSVADRLLFDAKPPKDARYPGGHGVPFDWSLLDALDPPVPFMLSGGLRPENVAEAIGRVRQGGARLTGVDVSSGVETAPGVKDIGLIRAFVAAARAAA